MLKNLLNIFRIFFKIGATTFGGGYSMLPIIEQELVENSKLINDEEFMDFISIAQSFPGPVAVNISLLLGYRLNGVIGSIFALLGVTLPSFVSIVFIGYFYNRFHKNVIIESFFSGVNAVIPALLLLAFFSVFKKIGKKKSMYLIFIASFVAVFFFDINPIITILAGGIIGLCIK